MSAPPRTTQLGPDQATLRTIIRRIAEAEADDAFIVSAYVDMEPSDHGERPAERPELVAVRRRLRELQRGLPDAAPQRGSLDADVDRIERRLEDADFDGSGGVALFACDRIGLWEEVQAAEPFTTQVAAGRTADLFQLARLLDDSVGAVVAVVDTSTCRLFVTRRGAIEERPGPDEPPDDHRRPDRGGWSQARYQRHVDMHDKRFAKEAASALERLVEAEKAQHVFLAGDDRSVPILEAELSEAVRALVEHVLHLEMRSGRDEISDEVLPVLKAIESAEEEDLADQAIGAWRAGGLGVVGTEATLAALDWGQVDQLVLDESAPLDEERRAELVRRAALTDAGVEVVHDHPRLAAHEGVGATLRFRV